MKQRNRRKEKINLQIEKQSYREQRNIVTNKQTDKQTNKETNK